MAATAPVLDPLIAQARFRMRLRRGLIAALVLLAAVLAFVPLVRTFHGSGLPTTSGGDRNTTLARITIDAHFASRECPGQICDVIYPAGLPKGTVGRLERTVVSAASKTSIKTIQLRYQPKTGTVDAVLAPASNPSQHPRRLVERLVGLLSHGYPSISVVYGKAAPRLPHPSKLFRGMGAVCWEGFLVKWNHRPICLPK